PWAAVAVGLASFALATTNLWQRHREAAVEQPAAQAPRPAGASLAGAPATALRASESVLTGTPSGGDGSRPSAPLAGLVCHPPFRTDRDGAIGELLALWGADYDPAAGDPCRQAELQGLRCLALDRGSLVELRRVNWPAILQLVDDHGAEHHVVITSLGYDAAT